MTTLNVVVVDDLFLPNGATFYRGRYTSCHDLQQETTYLATFYLPAEDDHGFTEVHTSGLSRLNPESFLVVPDQEAVKIYMPNMKQMKNVSNRIARLRFSAVHIWSTNPTLEHDQPQPETSDDLTPILVAPAEQPLVRLRFLSGSKT